MSKIKIIYVTIGVWAICCCLAAYYHVTSIGEASYISLWGKLAIFAFFNFPYWLLGLLAIVFLEILGLKPFYQRLNSSFVVGSAGALIFYFVMTDYIDRSTHAYCSHCVERFGFPFRYIETKNHFSAPAGILWLGLLANILVGLVFSAVAGFAAKRVWSIFSAPRLYLK